jgi:translation initiation factor IF-2
MTFITIGNLPLESTEAQIVEFFEGKIKCRLALTKDGRNKGFAFVTVLAKEDVEACVARNGEKLAGREVIVDRASHPTPQKKAKVARAEKKKVDEPEKVGKEGEGAGKKVRAAMRKAEGPKKAEELKIEAPKDGGEAPASETATVPDADVAAPTPKKKRKQRGKKKVAGADGVVTAAVEGIADGILEAAEPATVVPAAAVPDAPKAKKQKVAPAKEKVVPAKEVVAPSKEKADTPAVDTAPSTEEGVDGTPKKKRSRRTRSKKGEDGGEAAAAGKDSSEVAPSPKKQKVDGDKKKGNSNKANSNNKNSNKGGNNSNKGGNNSKKGNNSNKGKNNNINKFKNDNSKKNTNKKGDSKTNSSKTSTDSKTDSKTSSNKKEKPRHPKPAKGDANESKSSSKKEKIAGDSTKIVKAPPAVTA